MGGYSDDITEVPCLSSCGVIKNYPFLRPLVLYTGPYTAVLHRYGDQFSRAQYCRAGLKPNDTETQRVSLYIPHIISVNKANS